MEHELIELRKHISAQGILVQDLMTGVCRELEGFNQSSGDSNDSLQDFEVSELKDCLPNEFDDQKMIFLEKIDILLAEHRIEEALEAFDVEEKNFPELKASGDTLSKEASSYKSALMQRKSVLESQLVDLAEQPLVSNGELKKSLSALIRLDKGPLAHQLLLKVHQSRLQKRIDGLLPSYSVCPKTFPATLSKIVFSAVSLAIKESGLMFGDNPIYTNRVVQWAEWEVEFFVRLMKENSPSPETISALQAASICVQSSLNYCSILEAQGLKLSKLLLVLLRPYIEEVLELNFRRARRVLLDLAESDASLPLSPYNASSLSVFASIADSLLIESGMRFMSIVEVS